MPVASLAEINLPKHRIVGSFDQDEWAVAEYCLQEIGDSIGLAKFSSLADQIGVPQVIQRAAELGTLSMLDYKIHDIDKTNFKRARDQVLAGASIITAHGSNSPEALQDIVNGVNEAMIKRPELERPWVLGVTVLTSITDKGEVCTSIYGANRKAKVRQFARQAAAAGFDGIVCSPGEAEMIKNDPLTAHLRVVLPAIRPEYATKDDEQRANAMTPKRAMEAGGDLLIVGRPLTDAPEYGLTYTEAAHIIAEGIKEGLGG